MNSPPSSKSAGQGSPPRASSLRYQPVSIEPGACLSENNTHTMNPHASARLVASFWGLGLLNNSAYVIMIASAKQISESGTALVFLANILPSFVVKATAPYWFDRIPYAARLKIATWCMVVSFGLVAITSSKNAAASNGGEERAGSILVLQLLGVAFGSAQAGLGEASLLAMAGKADAVATTCGRKGECLTSFSSGTGMAGVFGFFWKAFWNDWMGYSLSTTLWLAQFLAISYWMTFRFAETHQPRNAPSEPTIAETSEASFRDDDDQFLPLEMQALAPSPKRFESQTASIMEISGMSTKERFQLVLSLWPYMIPLFVVYASEYALQSGTWTAIGFPLESIQARDTFYEYSNWLYQAGVFVSRSSGTLLTSPMWVLWLMPALQFANLIFYTYVGSDPTLSWLYQPWILYSAAFYTGLLGGAVYVHGYKRICRDLPLVHREFALSATSVAESLGILVADVMGLMIQSCLYEMNGLGGALLRCPI